MTAIQVIWPCFYLTEVDGITWRGQDYTAMKMIKAVKGEPINGYVEVSIGGQHRRFDQSNIEPLVSTMGKTIGSKLRKTSDVPTISIVPIPNSGAVVGSSTDCRTDALARNVAEGFGTGAAVEPIIRWKAARSPQHKGTGFRDPDMFQEQMSLLRNPKHPVVLFDDVMTSGSQLIAAARLLQEAEHTPILASVVGRVTKAQREQMLGWNAEELMIDRTLFDL
jgi:hypothetical protein